MEFNSLEFAVFLPIVFLLYWLVFNKSAKSQNTLLLIASYIFYAFTDWRFLGLIAVITLCSFGFGLGIAKFKANSDEKKAKALSATNIVVNLLVLGFFKYFNFFIESFASIFPNITVDNIMIKIALPLGISYYTFSALSYTIDVYRGKTHATKDIAQFALYLSNFPQLIAGPIGRSTYLLPQYAEQRTFHYKDGVDGLRQFLWGLYKKVIVADYCAVYVQMVNMTYQDQPGSALLIALFLGVFQVYADFSGYSDMAIGIAHLFGINIHKNFDNPFFSHNIAEFWSKWHISLTNWLKDYIYKPLRGWNRTTIIRNIFIVFIVCGLWHGASWNFVLWGVYNAVLFTILIVFNQWKKEKTGGGFSILLTFIFVSFGFLICGTDTVNQTWQYLQIMCHWETMTALYKLLIDPQLLKRAITIFIMLFVEWSHRYEEYPFSLGMIKNHALRMIIYYVLVAVILLLKIEGKPIIYAQF